MKRIAIGLLLLVSGAVRGQEIGLCTERGLWNEVNEDACDTFVVGDDRFCVVCDGVGGAVGGGTASRIAVRTLRAHLERNGCGPGAEAACRTLSEAMKAADREIRRCAAADTALRGMASTCLLVLVRNDTLYYSHAGDCRLYGCTDGRLRRFTEDDSYMNLLLAAGEITPRAAKRHPLRRAIVNALGGPDPVEPHVGAGYPLGEGALLCSDGLYGALTEARIGRILRRYGDDGCPRIARELVAKAVRAGGEDDISVILIKRR